MKKLKKYLVAWNYVGDAMAGIGDKSPNYFECSAEDREHAIEQTENAYPGCVILDAATKASNKIKIYI